MTPLIKRRVLQEIELIPEDKLADLYNFLHYFRLGLEKAHPPKREQILAFAGCWQDMPDEMFAKVPQDTLSKSFPQEWIDYIHRERENRDEDEWYSPKREPDSSDPDTEQGGSHEVLAAEETV